MHYVNLYNSSEVLKGSSLTSATKSLQIPGRKNNLLPGHPVDMVEGRRISFLPGFQDSSLLPQPDEPCKIM